MLATRAPLFSVSIAFALGCLLGLDGIVPLSVALITLLLTATLWWRLGRHEDLSLAAFYGFVACAGIAHTTLLDSTISPDDLRRLPDDKLLATTQWRGVIIAEPAEEQSTRISRRTLDRTSFVLRVESWRPTEGRLFDAEIDSPWHPAQGDLRCTVLGPASELKCGDGLQLAAALTPVPPPLCPGELNLPAWEAAQGIYFHTTISPLDWRRVESGGGDWWQNLSFRARDWAYGRLQIGLEDDPRMADFLAGMLIGYRQQIPADIEQDFRRTGTLHVFAVSGQNIAEMVVVAMILLQLFGLVRWRWAWTLAPVVLLYCLLTGSPASAIRATVMALAVLLAWRLGRPLHALGCWSLAFLAMLIWNPPLLLDPGAQLSFGVVLAIILIAPPLTHFLARGLMHDSLLPVSLLTAGQKREERFWWWFCALVASGVAATFASEPITALDFHQVTPISIVANLVVVPIAGIITMVGTLSVAVSLVATPLTALLNNANWLLARLLILFVGFLAHHPGASINVPDLRALGSTPDLVVAPVQDTACLLLRTTEGAWLINTGREAPARSVTAHLLQFYGINHLAGVVLAQVSVADNSGAEIVMDDFRPERLIIPKLTTRSPAEKMLSDAGVFSMARVESWQQGQIIALGSGLRVEVLRPAADARETKAEDRALVLLFHAESQTLLWAGKIGPKVQAELLSSFPGLHADVLVMGVAPPPDRAWLAALGVRDWLQIPSSDRLLNSKIYPIDVTDLCRVWPLDETGAVDLHFNPARADRPPEILLHPWLKMPDGF